MGVVSEFVLQAAALRVDILQRIGQKVAESCLEFDENKRREAHSRIVELKDEHRLIGLLFEQALRSATSASSLDGKVTLRSDPSQDGKIVAVITDKDRRAAQARYQEIERQSAISREKASGGDPGSVKSDFDGLDHLFERGAGEPTVVEVGVFVGPGGEIRIDGDIPPDLRPTIEAMVHERFGGRARSHRAMN